MKTNLLVMLALAAAPALAQVLSPGALQQLRIEEEERRRQLERLEQQRAAEPKIEPPAAPAAPQVEPAPVRFLVREIRFSPSAIFSEAELREFANAYEGRELKLADLQQLTAEINAAYKKRGIVTAQAVIPPQNVSSGVVQIRLVEGRVGSILLKGNTSTASGYITDRITQQPGDLVSLPALEQDLIRFNRTNDVRLKAQLAPGAYFSTTDLLLDVDEPPPHGLRLFTDNNGAESTGEERVGVVYSNRSLTGYRDELALSTTQSGGQQSYSASYGRAINRLGGRATLAYNQDYIQIRHGPFSSLDITGEAKSLALNLRLPTVVDRLTQMDLLGSVKGRQNDNWISGVFLNRAETADLTLGAELQQSDTSGYWIGSYSYTVGQAKSVEWSNYLYGRGWLRRQQNLAEPWSLIGSLSFQHTNEELLPSSEQFFVGGEGSVRGYPVGAFAGDNGYTVSAELHHPLGSLKDDADAVRVVAAGFVFADYGRVRPDRPPGSTLRSYEQLSSVGWGVSAVIDRNITAKVTGAYLLDRLPTTFSDDRFTLLFQVIASVF